jgi:2-oxoglutarate dehydrogenase complex dehydrogenase (E1) component-like enzyme
MHIQDREQCNWLRTRVELNVFSQKTKNSLYTPSQEDRLNCLDRLIWATKLEEFLQQKFSDKRFGCDGAEVIIPGMKTLVDHAADLGVKGEPPFLDFSSIVPRCNNFFRCRDRHGSQRPDQPFGQLS